ncbi:MAG TPA: Mov34/MPN/PAD-1 family protein [Gemmatimonadales bacterium]|nr:Mov34/MPN/PAD-1 family protein [Gemmatimonadales bacterium]
MHGWGGAMFSRAMRALAAATGLMVLLALQPEPARLIEAASMSPGSHARALIFSEQARRYLALQYRSYPTEFMGCMIGELHGNAVLVSRIAPADVDPAQSTATRVLPKQTCEDAGWKGTVGMIHSHPTGERCWYYFPGTQVPSSDAESFGRQPYPVDAIMCGDHVVWISRDMVEQQVRLSVRGVDAHPASTPHQRGNRVHAGAASPDGQD